MDPRLQSAIEALHQPGDWVHVATIGRDGGPHVTPMMMGLEPPYLLFSFTGKQKVRNLERDPRATLLVEAGELYHELRGVMLECETVVHRDQEAVSALGREIFMRYAAPRGEPAVHELPPEVRTMVDRQAAKRVGLEFVELRRASWDHRKLEGVY